MKDKKIEILNLYAGIGGNRLLWENCNVTAVELDENIANAYSLRFSNDKIIIGDAHEYLKNNFENFDFIWSSPPCQTHSIVRLCNPNYKKEYPNMQLYEEIIFLKQYAKGIKWVIENVVSYYEPLIKCTKIGRHYFWSNFYLGNYLIKKSIKLGNERNEVKKLYSYHNVDVSILKGLKNKQQVLRNMVHYSIGKSIYDKAVQVYNAENYYQGVLF